MPTNRLDPIRVVEAVESVRYYRSKANKLRRINPDAKLDKDEKEAYIVAGSTVLDALLDGWDLVKPE